MTPSVIRRFDYSHVGKKTPLGEHIFSQQIGTIFELIQDIIRTYVLTKLHEDLTIYVTS